MATGTDTGGNSFSIPDASSSGTNTATRNSSSGGSTSYYDAVSGDSRFGFKGPGSTTGSAGSIPGLKINSQGQATDNAGNLSMDKAPSNPTVYPVMSANKAITDLNGKKATFNDIQSGVANQQLANTQLGTFDANQAQDKAVKDAASAPSNTLNDIKDIVSGSTQDQNNSLKEVDNQATQAYNDYKNRVDQIRRGTFPLSPDQQAQVDYTKYQFDRLQQEQIVANKNYEGAMKQLGVVSGRDRFAPEIQTGLMQQVVADGITKIADIEAKAANTMATLRQGFQDSNYKLINDSYSALTNLLKQKSDTINQIAQNTKAAADFALNVHNQQYQEDQNKLKEYQANKEAIFASGIKTPYVNKNGEIQQSADGRSFGTEAEFQQATGMTIQEAEQKGLVTQMDSTDTPLSLAELKAYGLPYGTTQKQAAEMGITPSSDSGGGGGTVSTFETDENGKTWKVTTKDGVQTSKVEQKLSDKVPTESIDGMGQDLQSLTGYGQGDPNGDNYVSADSYNEGLQNWTSQGFSAKTYYDNFKKYINPDHQNEYNYYPKANGATSTQNNSGLNASDALNSGGLTINGQQVKGWSSVANKLPLLNSDGSEKKLPQVYPPGSNGGQCGVWVRNLVNKQGLDYPKLGDTLTSKAKAVRDHGTQFGGPGEVIVTNESKSTGHVAYVIGANYKGYILAESNYGLNGKVSYGRVIPYGSKSIIGFIKPS